MSREKIEEMAKIICRLGNSCQDCYLYPDDCKAVKYAERFYTAGYRKQSGWIGVDERLPEESCECLAVGRTGVIYLLQYSCRYKAFNAHDEDGGDRWKVGDITHWMPLPEPPKGD